MRWLRRPGIRAGWGMSLVLSLAVAANVLCFSLLQKGILGALPVPLGFDPSLTVVELRLSPTAHATPASQTEL